MAKTKEKYGEYDAIKPYSDLVLQGLRGQVDGGHFFDVVADDIVYQTLYNFPGWPVKIKGRKDLMAAFAGYGEGIRIRSADKLIVHHSKDDKTTILEYEVHGKILSSGARYDNRFISVITVEKRKIAFWRDYMDSLAAWNTLNAGA
jgi:ketosteroid isomerase-like protein